MAAFAQCRSLEGFSLSSTVSSVGTLAFSACTKLRTTVYENGIYLGNESNPYHLLIAVADASAKSFAIHKDTKIISASDVSGTMMSTGIFASTDVETADLSGSVVSVSGALFQNAKNLKSVVLPPSMTSLAADAFSGCSALESITLPSGLTSIGDRAFSGTTALKEIRIPASVTEMGSDVIDETSGIRSVLCEAAREPLGWSIDWVYDISLATFGAK